MKDGLACLEQFSHMAPIHAHERNGTVTRKCCGMTERLLQEEPLSDVGALQSRSPASRPS
jgi:hypothetical protein